MSQKSSCSYWLCEPEALTKRAWERDLTIPPASHFAHQLPVTLRDFGRVGGGEGALHERFGSVSQAESLRVTRTSLYKNLAKRLKPLKVDNPEEIVTLAGSKDI